MPVSLAGPVTARDTICFDDQWRFAVNREAPVTTPTVIFSNAQAPAYDDSGWRTVDLPHDWSIEDIQPANEAFSGPFFPGAVGKQSQGFTVGGTGWYRKAFTVPETYRGKHICLRFDGVYRDADVWLNGQHLGNHPYGYTEFSFDLTPHLRYGEEANVIAVEVKNPGRNSRWYSGSGIYRHVWLTVMGPIRVVGNGTFVTTPEVSTDRATVSVSNELTNRSEDRADVAVSVSIRDAAGKTVAEQTVSTRIQAGQRYPLRQRLAIESPQLWSPDTPVLYVAVTEIRRDGELLDRVETPFGIRTIQFDAEHGFRLNGVAVNMKGGCVHHDNGPLGAAAFDAAEERRVRLLKEAGFNAIRCAHNPPSPGFLAACDRLGMFVIDEAFDQWKRPKNPQDYHNHFAKWGEADMAGIVRRDRNHPSVVLWSIGNEIPEQETLLGTETAQLLADCIRRHDTTRPVMLALHPKGQQDINGLFKVPWEEHDGVNSSMDVCGYNYRVGRYESDHERNPNRVICASETFAKQAHKYWDAVERLPYVVGDFVWTSFDYLGEASIGWFGFHDKFPWTVAYCGDLDLCGQRRPQSYYRGVLWNHDEPLALFVRHPEPTFSAPSGSAWDFADVSPSWNWGGREGQALDVVVYSRCAHVELFLNGRSLGSKPFSADSAYAQEWQVPFEPGTLEAVGTLPDGTQAVQRLETVGELVQVRLTPERTELTADGQDLAFVLIEFLDAAGRAHPVAENLVQACVEGPALLAALGSGRPDSVESFQQPQRHAFRGKALAILRTTTEAGAIRLTVSSPGLAAATLEYGGPRISDHRLK
jgi:beta-galactosidase